VGGTGSGPASPTVDALGLACTDRCPSTFQCWSASGEPPGVCVPSCGASLPECPASYTCQESASVCVPSQAIRTRPKTNESGGCSVGAPASSPGSAGYLVVLALGLLARRRST